jgi:hypothetical protein
VVAIDPVMWYAKSDNFFLSSRTSDGGGVTLLRGGGVYQVVRNVMPDIPSGGTILGATNYWLDGRSEAALGTPLRPSNPFTERDTFSPPSLDAKHSS